MLITRTPGGTRHLPVTLQLVAADGQGWERLTDNERDEARRIARSDDRDRFVSGRALLRELLPPGTTIRRRPDGSLTCDADVHVSVSHSAGWAAAAVCPSPVGLDVQAVTDGLDDPVLHRRTCTAREREGLTATGFLRLWVRKEALRKSGVPGDLHELEVLDDSAHGRDLHDLVLPEGLTGAVAVQA
jgi:phosphopantetheinyl transferase